MGANYLKKGITILLGSVFVLLSKFTLAEGFSYSYLQGEISIETREIEMPSRKEDLTVIGRRMVASISVNDNLALTNYASIYTATYDDILRQQVEYHSDGGGLRLIFHFPIISNVADIIFATSFSNGEIEFKNKYSYYDLVGYNNTYKLSIDYEEYVITLAMRTMIIDVIEFNWAIDKSFIVFDYDYSYSSDSTKLTLGAEYYFLSKNWSTGLYYANNIDRYLVSSVGMSVTSYF